ncbi:MAG: hypothetical protein LBB08_00345 [Rickettsiales bacterium]|jgi:DNA repair protein RadC|nr:hypothetical protein [Rickettsiales bacterium]
MHKVYKTENLNAGHRARIMRRFIAGNADTYDVMEMVLAGCMLRIDTESIMKRLFAKFGSASGILSASISELLNIDGIGEITAIHIKGIHALMLAGYEDRLGDAPVFQDAKILRDYLLHMLNGKRVEQARILLLDSNKRLISSLLISDGGFDGVNVDRQKIVKLALDSFAKHVILVHNHPDASGAFSTSDVEATIGLKHALHGVEIDLDDHYVVAGGAVYSMRELYLLD